AGIPPGIPGFQAVARSLGTIGPASRDAGAADSAPVRHAATPRTAPVYAIVQIFTANASTHPVRPRHRRSALRSPFRHPGGEVQAVQCRRLPVDRDLVRRPAVVVGVTALERSPRIPWVGWITPISPGGNRPARRVGNI